MTGLSELVVQHGHFSYLRRGETLRDDPGIQLVFAGGTCLSKAHGLIERMSEDVDIKVVLKPIAKPLTKGRSDRVRLVALQEMVRKLLERLDYPLLTYADGANPQIRDVHRYYVIGAGYASAYPQLPSLRRCAYQWDGHQIQGAMDPALVRHVYDIACIAAKVPGELAAGRDIFGALVRGDQAEFMHQNPEFDANPVEVLKRALATAKTDPTLRQRYANTLLPVVYEERPPTFDQALGAFEAVAQDFLSAN